MPKEEFKVWNDLFDEIDSKIESKEIEKDNHYFQKFLKNSFKHRKYVFDLDNKESKRLSAASNFGIYVLIYMSYKQSQ
jgi:hypothetical protein